MRQIFTNFFLLSIIFYQKTISRFTKASCRFYPTCSSYSYQAIKTYGIPKGLILTFKRISRCHPLCKGGFDPIP